MKAFRRNLEYEYNSTDRGSSTMQEAYSYAYNALYKLVFAELDTGLHCQHTPL
jgi:hypothetical protein